MARSGRRMSSTDSERGEKSAAVAVSQGLQENVSSSRGGDGGQQQQQQQRVVPEEGGRELSWDHPPTAAPQQRSLSPMHVSHDARALDGVNAHVWISD